MRYLSRGIVAAALFLAPPPSLSRLGTAEPKAERVDAFGDPLPAECVRRLGSIHFRSGDGVQALIPCPDGKTLISGSTPFRGPTFCVWEMATGRLLHRLPGGSGRHYLALSSDGILATTSEEGIRLWDAATGRERRWFKGEKYGKNGLKLGLGFSPDGQMLVTCDAKNLHVWNATTGAEIVSRPWPRRRLDIVLFAFTPDGKTLIAGGQTNSTVHRWDTASWKERPVLNLGEGRLVDSLGLSGDGRFLAAGIRGLNGTGPGHISLWSLADDKEVRQLQARLPLVTAVALSPDGKRLASVEVSPGTAARIHLWNGTTGERLHSFAGGASCLAFSRDGKILFAGGSVIRRWEVATGKEIDPPSGHHWPVEAVVRSPDGRRLASLSPDGVRLWETNTGVERHCFAPASTGLTDCACAPDGKTLAVVSRLGSLSLWDTVTGKEVRRIEAPVEGKPAYPGQKGERLSTVAFSPDGRSLATGSWEGTVCLWNARTGQRMRCLKCESPFVEAVAFSADGRFVFAATRTPEGTDVRAWDVSRGEELPQLTAAMNARMLRIDADRLNYSNRARLALSADGRMLALNREKTISVWETATGQERLRLQGHTQPTLAVAFSPDGRLLASAARDGTLRLWDLATGTERKQLAGHRGNVNALVFSPDGKWLYSGGEDTSVLVWDVARIVRDGLPAIPRLVVQTAWKDLAGDAAGAYQAMHALRADPAQALPLLSEHLRPAQPVEKKRLAELIRKLDADEFAVRDEALGELEKLGEAAESSLRQALQGMPTLEVRRRIDALLEKLLCPSAETARPLRAVEVLEHIGSREARQVLQTLADGFPEARLTREAKAALDRLALRPSAAP